MLMHAFLDLFNKTAIFDVLHWLPPNDLTTLALPAGVYNTLALSRLASLRIRL
jgi:hypothetical protein